MSKRIDHAIEVCQEVEKLVMAQLDLEPQIDTEEVEECINTACKTIALRERIQPSTVKSQLTRELGLSSMANLKEQIIDHLVSENKRYSSFSKTLCTHLCEDDTEEAVRNRLEKI